MLAAHTHRAPEALGHVEHSEHSTGLPGTPGDQPAADGLPGTRRGSASGSEQEQGAAEQGYEVPKALPSPLCPPGRLQPLPPLFALSHGDRAAAISPNRIIVDSTVSGVG